MPRGIPAAPNSAATVKRKPGRPRSVDAKTKPAKAAQMAATTVSAPTERRKPGRPKGSVNKKSSTATAKARSGPSPRAASRAEPVAQTGPTPKVSKDDLRARVEKLERANAVLRSKGKEAARAAKAAADQVAGLEAQLAKFERASARREAPSKSSSKA